MKSISSIGCLLTLFILLMLTGCASPGTDAGSNPQPQRDESRHSGDDPGIYGDPQIELFKGGGGLQWKF